MKVHAVSFKANRVVKPDIHPYMYTPEIKDHTKIKKDLKIVTAICAITAVCLTLANMFKK